MERESGHAFIESRVYCAPRECGALSAVPVLHHDNRSCEIEFGVGHEMELIRQIDLAAYYYEKSHIYPVGNHAVLWNSCP